MISASIVIYQSNLDDIKNIINILSLCKIVNEILIHDNSKSNYLEKHIDLNNKKISYLFNNKNIGYGPGHNKNFKRKKHNSKFFLVINTDIKFNSRFLYMICDELTSSNKAGALIPKIFDYNGNHKSSFREFPNIFTLIFRFLIAKLKLKYLINLFIEQTVIRKFPLAQGPFILLPSKIFEEINGFDERFFLYMEDIDLQRRIYDKGYSIKFSNLYIYHKHNKESFRNIKVFFYHIHSCVKYFLKYGFIFDKKRNLYNKPTDTLLLINGNYEITKRFRGQLVEELSHKLPIYITDETINNEIQCFNIIRVPFDVEKTKISLLSFIKSFIHLLIIIVIKKPKYIIATHSKSILVTGLIGIFFKNTKKIAMFTGLGYLFHNGLKNKNLNMIIHTILKIVTNSYNLVYSHNDGDRKFLINNKYTNSKKIFTINGSGVDINIFKPVKYQNNTDNFKFIYTGRILKTKGIIELVNTFKNIRKLNKNIFLDIYGNFDSNPESIQRKDFLNSIKKIENIKYIGFKKNLEHVYTKYDAYITASHYEGMSRSILEALSCGLPIIATNINGCKEAVVEGFNGYLFSVNDENSMKTAILKLYEKRRNIQTYKSNSRKLAVSKFDVKKINQSIIDQIFKI